LTAYEKICASRCPGCVASNILHNCTAPSESAVIEELAGKLEEAKRDGERLDWLLDDAGWNIAAQWKIVDRTKIDAAMRASREKGEGDA